MSLLKKEIEKYHEKYLLPVGEKVVAYFMEQFLECNEDSSITEYEAYICQEDNKDFWEDVIRLSDCDKDLLANTIGVTLTYPNAMECRVKWSGK